MRVKRLKHVKKYLNFFTTTFGFHQPYQILLDLTFCQEALTYKVNIKEQIPKYIEGESQLFTTSCILAEGEVLGPQLGGAVHICKQFKLRKCGHKKESVPAEQCIRELIGQSNPNRLIVASQDAEMKSKLRAVPGVPLLHINYNALVLEKPSKSSQKAALQLSKGCPGEHEQARLDKMREEKGLQPKKEKVVRVTKRQKNPNPLSVKKKSKDSMKSKNKEAIVGDASGKKRRKRRHKLAQHVVDALSSRPQGITAGSSAVL